MPDQQPPIPVVLIIAGSGPTDRNGNQSGMVNNALKQLAHALAQQGIASLRYDKRGVAGSYPAGINEAELRFDHYVDDAKGWIESLNQSPRFSDVWVMGHSEGSLIGMRAAQTSDVSRFISLSGPAQGAAQILSQQLAALPEELATEAEQILQVYRHQVQQLFDGYLIEQWTEQDSKGMTALGQSKHWHTYQVIARKKSVSTSTQQVIAASDSHHGMTLSLPLSTMNGNQTSTTVQTTCQSIPLLHLPAHRAISDCQTLHETPGCRNSTRCHLMAGIDSGRTSGHHSPRLNGWVLPDFVLKKLPAAVPTTIVFGRPPAAETSWFSSEFHRGWP